MIEVKNLSFSYAKSDKLALKNLNFAIEKGEIFGFLGPSGAGKSTTQKILIGLLKKYQGKATVFGQDLQNYGADYYEKVGVSFEFPNHYKKLTALENLEFFRSLYSGGTNDPKELLTRVGLEADANTLVSQFSKGMQMRLNFARALLNKPDLLFLDEPTSGLDPVNAKNIKEMVREQKRAGKTIFLTTHNMNVADELCDRVAFIVDGEIAHIDSPRNLKIQHGARSLKVEYRAESGTQTAEFPLDGLAQNDQFQSLLQQGNIETMHTQEATLEDIFIKVTGRSLT